MIIVGKLIKLYLPVRDACYLNEESLVVLASSFSKFIVIIQRLRSLFINLSASLGEKASVDNYNTLGLQNSFEKVF